LVDAIQRNPKKFSLSRDGHFVVTQEFKTPDELLSWTTEFLEKVGAAQAAKNIAP
jgi:hypothetical protein